MKTVFSDLFHQALAESRSACAVDCHNRAYLKLQEDYCNVMDEIQDKLGPERSLLFRMEDLNNAMRGMDLDWMTRQAFRDCMYVLRYMDAFSLPDGVTH